MVRYCAGYQLDALLRVAGGALSARDGRSLRHPHRGVGDLRRALQGLVPRICDHPAREGFGCLLGEGGIGALQVLRTGRRRLGLRAQAALRRRGIDRVSGLPSFQARMSRFGPSPAMRNMSVYGMLDELRHTQLQLFFPHELVHLDRQYDWAHEAQHSKNWAVLGGRHAFDDIMMTRDAVTSSIMVSFAFETALTNLQMIGLSTDAANMGDHTFSNLITSIQSDEARHAQLGTPTIEIMIRNGRKKGSAAGHGHRALARLAALLDHRRHPDGLLHPARAAAHVLQGVHARVGDQPVGAAGAGPRPGAAVVLGHLPHRHRQPPSLPAGRHLVMAADGLVESAGRGGAQGARVARGEISRLETRATAAIGM